LASLHVFVFPKIILSSSLLEAVTIFTDASGCGAAAFYTKDCHKIKHTVFASAQRAVMYAVIMVLRDFSQQPINLCSDSHYVVGVLCHIETAYIGHTSSEELFNLSFQLCSLVQTCLYPCFVSHLCSHSNLPSLFADGNALADNLVSGLALGLPTQTAAPIEAARLSHAVHHQNASAWCRQFHLTREQAGQIIKSCRQCVTFATSA
jgi:hypothetical protein